MHEASVFFCPVESCNRHTRAFPREYNLGDHIARVHKELDVTAHLKKTKRSAKKNTVAANVSKAIPVAGFGSRRQSNIKSKRETSEKRYKALRGKIARAVIQLPEHPDLKGLKDIQDLVADVGKLLEQYQTLAGLDSSSATE